MKAEDKTAAEMVGQQRPRQLVVVCTANICRSPMVEGLIRDRLEQERLADRVQISSAGVFGLDGERASRDGVELLAARDIDISDHVARSLTYQQIENADLILVMEENHRSAIFVRAPQHLHKVILFSELINEHTDLRDPYRRGRAAYEAALAQFDLVLDGGWPLLIDKLELDG